MEIYFIVLTICFYYDVDVSLRESFILCTLIQMSLIKQFFILCALILVLQVEKLSFYVYGLKCRKESYSSCYVRMAVAWLHETESLWKPFLITEGGNQVKRFLTKSNKRSL